MKEPEPDVGSTPLQSATSGGQQEQSTCCIAGCGPAGAVLALLLARAGIDVIVLEKHSDFLRDFRGDTIHPSTLEILDELGLADRFLALPHTEARSLTGSTTSGEEITFSFERLPSRFRFIAFVPQWDFLAFITAEAARYPGFRLVMNAEVVDVVPKEGGQRGAIGGVRYLTQDGEKVVRADLVVGADGRGSRTRDSAGLPLRRTSPPMDVLWFRLSRRPEDPEGTVLRLGAGALAVLQDRRQYWQIGYVIPKGGAERVRAAGIDTFREGLTTLVPELGDRVGEISSWDDVKVLIVRSDRLKRWHREGYLAIGDAAHAMSPVGGVGINTAIHDAVTAANLLWRPLREGTVSEKDLTRVQGQRQLPVIITQAVQALVQRAVIKTVLNSSRSYSIPRLVRAVARLPGLRALPGRLVGFGVRRPHVQTPSAFPPSALARAEGASR